jgi:tripartite ATP-independent transporter DctP family solute receptor
MSEPSTPLKLLLILALIAAFASHAADRQQGQRVIWAHVYEITEPLHQHAVWAAEEINRRSGGRFDVQVFPASTLGKEASLNQSLSLGVIDIIYTGTSFAAQTFEPLSLSEYPYVFTDLDHWQDFYSGPLFGEMAREYSDASGGNVIVATGYYGQRHVTSNQKIESPEDMTGLKIRVPNAALFKMFPEATGARPSPIAFSEVYLALQQGVVAAQENPLPTIKAKRFYEVQSTISLTGHIFGSTLTIAGGAFWDELAPDDRRMFKEVIQLAVDKVSGDTLAAEEYLVEWFRDQGIDVIEVDRDAFRAVVMLSHAAALTDATRVFYERMQATQ